MFILTLSAALALDCDAGDAACSDANALRDAINAVAGPGTIADTGVPTRRSTGQIRNRLDAIYAVAAEHSCTLTGWSAFTYGATELSGDWLDTSENSGSLTGSLDRGSKTWAATAPDSAFPAIGSEWGLYNRQHQIAADRGLTAIAIGSFVRTVGTNGVGYTADFDCGSTQAGFAFDNAYAGDLPYTLGECPIDDPCVTNDVAANASVCEECIALTCATDSWCCEVNWDNVCVNQSLQSVCPDRCDFAPPIDTGIGPIDTGVGPGPL